MNPPFPYAGGKRRMLKELKRYFPDKYHRYIEPFLGGGAVLFDLLPENAIVGDINFDVINTFRQIRLNPGFLIQILDSFVNSKDEFYRIRNMDRDPIYKDIPNAFKAARFIYQAKLGFGSKVRYNKKGYCNQAYSKRENYAHYNKDDIMNASTYLNSNHIIILHSDYKKILSLAVEGDFVYLDPPYINTYQDYFGKKWNENDYAELKLECDKLTEKGVKWVLSHNDNPYITNLFRHYDIHSYGIIRSIATVEHGNSDKAHQNELVIRNFVN